MVKAKNSTAGAEESEVGSCGKTGNNTELLQLEEVAKKAGEKIMTGLEHGDENFLICIDKSGTCVGRNGRCFFINSRDVAFSG